MDKWKKIQFFIVFIIQVLGMAILVSNIVLLTPEYAVVKLPLLGLFLMSGGTATILLLIFKRS